MTQEYYIKRGIEKFKALEDKTQTDLIDYLVMKVIACGFYKRIDCYNQSRFLFLYDALLGS